MTNLLLPGIGNPTSQVLDGLHPGITGQDQFDCPGVIGVNIKGKLLIAGKGFCIGYSYRFVPDGALLNRMRDCRGNASVRGKR